MPQDEGLALYEAGLKGAEHGPLLEIGSYCGRSSVYLGAAARERHRTGAQPAGGTRRKNSPWPQYWDMRLWVMKLHIWPKLQH
jgi:hypothetical protein